MADLNLRARLTLDSRQWGSGLRSATELTRTFSAGVRREMNSLRSFMQTTAGRVGTLTAGLSGSALVMQSARMDKSMARLGITAGASSQALRSVRKDLFDMGRETGASVQELEQGLSSLVASGLSLKESRATLQGMNRAMAISGASADTLANSMTVASSAFGIDLSDTKQAQLTLDKLAMAGQLGSAELEQLGAIFSRVGVNARGAGFDLDKTLGFIEALSKHEKNGERLGTLADSTLRLFTNRDYMQAAQKASGVKFFATDGSRRDPLAVLGELKQRMDKMKTDAEREGFLSKAFGGADLDTIRGMRMLTTGETLSNARKFSEQIANASGYIAKELPTALANSVDQAGRLRAVMGKTADEFSQKLNSGISIGIKKLLDSREQGGLGLSGGELAGGAAVATLAAYAGGRTLKGAAGRLLGGTAGLASGIAMGAALDKAGAATPVFVVGAAPGVLGGGGVGMPGTLGGAAAGGAASRLPWWRALGARAALAGGSSVFGAGGLATAGAGGALTTAGSVAGAGLAGWGIGTLLNKGINSNRYTQRPFHALAEPGLRNLTYGMAALGNSNARATVASEYRNGRGMTGLELATMGSGGPFNFIAQLSQTLLRAQREKAERGQARQDKLAVEVSVADKRTYATLQRVPGSDSGVSATVRSQPGPPVGRMMSPVR